MDQQLNRLIDPHLNVYFIVAGICALINLYFSPRIALAELMVLLVVFIYLTVLRKRRKKAALNLLEQLVAEQATANKESLLNAPFPMVIFRLNTEEIVWSNDLFLSVTGQKRHFFDTKISVAIPNFNFQWLAEGEKMSPTEFVSAGRRYMVFGFTTSVSEEGANHLAITYWIDVTELSDTCERYYATRPNVGIVLIDNYEDLIRNLPDNSWSTMRAAIEQELHAWISEVGGMVLRYNRDRYLFLLEFQQMEKFIKEKFSILDAIHKIVGSNGASVSLSIGIGTDGSFAEMLQFASQAVDMALSRGGDQAVIKNRFDFQFYGGRSREQERRTKVKSRMTAQELEELISNAAQVYVMGHRFADLDAVGAAAGVVAICRRKGVDVHIIREQHEVPGSIMLRHLAQTPEYERVFYSEEEALFERNKNTLLVVVDTNRPSQVVSMTLLDACEKVAVIDHHRRAADYIQNAVLNYQEPYASSASELVTELLQYTIEPSDLLRVEAEALLAGIVLDTKNFTLRTGGRTFEAAAYLRRCGADTVEVKRLFQTNLDDTIAKYQVLQSSQFYHQGVAVAAVDKPVGRIIAAQAADEMLNIEGVTASFVLYTCQDTVYISGRSTGDVNVQVILEDLGGGGNGASAGAQIKDQSLEVVTDKLRNAIDKYFSDCAE